MAKFFIEKYRVLSIWACIAILALAAVVLSDDTHKELCILVIFFLAAFLYGIGAFREWNTTKRKIMGLIQAVMAMMALTAAALQILRMGGIL